MCFEEFGSLSFLFIFKQYFLLLELYCTLSSNAVNLYVCHNVVMLQSEDIMLWLFPCVRYVLLLAALERDTGWMGCEGSECVGLCVDVVACQTWTISQQYIDLWHK